LKRVRVALCSGWALLERARARTNSTCRHRHEVRHWRAGLSGRLARDRRPLGRVRRHCDEQNLWQR
jgi:hypothetical protein